MNFHQRLRQRAYCFGTLLTHPAPVWLDAITGLGLDFIFIDTEHIPLDRNELAWMCRGAASIDLPPLVRISSHCPYEASRALDAGAQAILAPYVEEPTTVIELLGAVKYKPLKGAALQQLLQNTDAEHPSKPYIDAQNEQRSLLVNIESRRAIEALPEILSVAGLDGIVVGPHDLSVSLGCPEDYQASMFKDAVAKIFHCAREHGVSCGIHQIFSAPKEQLAAWAQDGATIFLQQADVLYLRRGVGMDAALLHDLLGYPTVADRGDGPAI